MDRQEDQVASERRLPRVEWSDLKVFAPDLFDVWEGGSEIDWAHNSWTELTSAGLTEFEGEVRRTQVLIRFISLAAFYHSWCQAAWQEGVVALKDWAETVEISRFRLAQLAGADFLEDVESDDDELFDDALREMVDHEYSRVVSVLSRKGDSRLFVSLWLSREAPVGAESPIDPNQVLNEDLTDDKFAGYGWIAEGCPLEPGG